MWHFRRINNLTDPFARLVELLLFSVAPVRSHYSRSSNSHSLISTQVCSLDALPDTTVLFLPRLETDTKDSTLPQWWGVGCWVGSEPGLSAWQERSVPLSHPPMPCPALLVQLNDLNTLRFRQLFIDF